MNMQWRPRDRKAAISDESDPQSFGGKKLNLTMITLTTVEHCTVQTRDNPLVYFTFGLCLVQRKYR